MTWACFRTSGEKFYNRKYSYVSLVLGVKDDESKFEGQGVNFKCKVCNLNLQVFCIHQVLE